MWRQKNATLIFSFHFAPWILSDIFLEKRIDACRNSWIVNVAIFKIKHGGLALGKLEHHRIAGHEIFIKQRWWRLNIILHMKLVTRMTNKTLNLHIMTHRRMRPEQFAWAAHFYQNLSLRNLSMLWWKLGKKYVNFSIIRQPWSDCEISK